MFPVKQDRVTPFGAWLRDNRYSDTAFAAVMDEVDPDSAPHSPRSVQNWRLGLNGPRGKAVQTIRTITKNAVDANSFVGVEPIRQRARRRKRA